MDIKLFNQQKFNKQIENLCLLGDDVISVGNFYETIDDTFKASHNLAFSVLPKIQDLSQGDTCW